jgi:hypothetical protein
MTTIIRPIGVALTQGGERTAVDLAIRQGTTDENSLTDLVFHARHPERGGRAIAATETTLVREWIDIRDHIVRPALAGRPAAPPPVAPTPWPAPRPSGGFRPIPVESPGGGRITDRRDPPASELVTITGATRPIRVHRLAADAHAAMVSAARTDGLAAPLMLPTSGYRSYSEQVKLWEDAKKRYGSEAEARKWVAPPGGSPHHSGRALDLYLGTSNDSSNVTRLRTMPAYQWLTTNAVRFGFYPYDREPWHWEYNPPALAQQELWSDNELLGLGGLKAALDRGSEWLALRLALAQGVRDENRLTDLVFHGRHPERGGRPLTAGERDLIREWLEIRDTQVRPLLAAPPTPSPPASDEDALAEIRRLTSVGGEPTVADAVALLQPLATVLGIPWPLAFIVLEHEGGVRLFHHHDGVMQTIASARDTIVPLLPRALKLALLGMPATDPTTDAALNAAIHREFPRRLAIQLATGTMELARGINRFNGYVALALVAYNAGTGSAYRVATGQAPPSGAWPSGDEWERYCRQGASLLHQRPPAVLVADGVWQCDQNLADASKPGSGWFRKFEVRDGRTRRLLIAYQYLRGVDACIREGRPTVPCSAANHAQRMPGTGERRCSRTRDGSLDKLYDAAKLGPSYRAAAAGFPVLTDDGAPVRVVGGVLVKLPAELPPG